MKEFDVKIGTKENVLALGAESAGNFSIYKKGKVFFSEDFGDLLENKNFQKYKRKLNEVLKKENIRPDVILCDLHPLFRTTELAKNLSEKYKAELIQVQHHTAHTFSAVGDYAVQSSNFKIPKTLIGIACDGTGLGENDEIWGGEILKFQKNNSRLKVERIAHLENQILLGGEMAIKEPARLIISILSKVKSQNPKSSDQENKKFVYRYVKKYYNKNEFELLWNQNQQKFNCLETSSTGRILDAVSTLLGFDGNKRKYKHAHIDALEKNSSKPYTDIEPKIEKKGDEFILNTTFLFEYLVNNMKKDKKRLAATAQLYIASGLNEICRLSNFKSQIYFAGGIANNKIISSYLENKGVYTSKEIPRGDSGISFGQLFYCLYYKNWLK